VGLCVHLRDPLPKLLAGIFVWFVLVTVFHRLSQLLWVHIFKLFAPLCLENTASLFSEVPLTWSLFGKVPQPSVESALQTAHSRWAAPHSLVVCPVTSWGSLSIAVYCAKKPLWWELRDSDLWVQQWVNGIGLILCSLSRARGVREMILIIIAKQKGIQGRWCHVH